MNQGAITPEMMAAIEMGMDLSQEAVSAGGVQSSEYAEDLSLSRHSPHEEHGEEEEEEMQQEPR